MATGLDAVFGGAKEVAYGTRIAPTRFFEMLANLGANYNREHYVSQGLGGGPWRKKRTQTTRRGDAEWQCEVPTTGFGFFLDLFHDQVPAVALDGASTTMYLQEHTLVGAPTKSASIQIGVPQTGATVTPFDYSGVTVRGISFGWEPGGVLTATITVLIKEEVVNLVLATPTIAESEMFSFKGGSLSLAGAPVANIHGNGSVGFEWPMRDDAYSLGGDGAITKPSPTDRPSMSGEFTPDFDSMTHYNRVANGELADLLLTFEQDVGEDLPAMVEVEATDVAFTGPSPQVEGPGPVTQKIAIEQASPTGTPPIIRYRSTDDAA